MARLMARLMAKLVSPACHQSSDSETINNTWNKKTSPTCQGAVSKYFKCQNFGCYHKGKGIFVLMPKKTVCFCQGEETARNSYAKSSIKPDKRKKSYQEYF